MRKYFTTVGAVALDAGLIKNVRRERRGERVMRGEMEWRRWEGVMAEREWSGGVSTCQAAWREKLVYVAVEARSRRTRRVREGGAVLVGPR